jgi:hypothetical protein
VGLLESVVKFRIWRPLAEKSAIFGFSPPGGAILLIFMTDSERVSPISYLRSIATFSLSLTV